MNSVNICQLLDDLSAELQHIGLWSEQPPSVQQLSSREPFCVDTMPFEHWLQWLFIPKMRAMLNTNFNGMPHTSDIHTMATYVFKPYAQDTQKTTEIILAIDKAINSFKSPSIH